MQVVCCQETNLPQQDVATQMWVARQLGWNVNFIQSFGSNNGGLPVAVREPLAVVVLAETSNDSGQMIQVEVHSSSVPFRLFNVYQRPGCWDPFISHPMLGLDNTPWVCCGDFNVDVRSLGFGTLVGTARHTTSKHPIDGVFASEMFLKRRVRNIKVLAMTTASLGPPSRALGSHHLVIPPFGPFAKIGKPKMQVWKTNIRTESSSGSTVSAPRRNGTIAFKRAAKRFGHNGLRILKVSWLSPSR